MEFTVDKQYGSYGGMSLRHQRKRPANTKTEIDQTSGYRYNCVQRTRTAFAITRSITSTVAPVNNNKKKCLHEDEENPQRPELPLSRQFSENDVLSYKSMTTTTKKKTTFFTIIISIITATATVAISAATILAAAKTATITITVTAIIITTITLISLASMARNEAIAEWRTRKMNFRARTRRRTSTMTTTVHHRWLETMRSFVTEMRGM